MRKAPIGSFRLMTSSEVPQKAPKAMEKIMHYAVLLLAEALHFLCCYDKKTAYKDDQQNSEIRDRFIQFANRLSTRSDVE